MTQYLSWPFANQPSLPGSHCRHVHFTVKNRHPRLRLDACCAGRGAWSPVYFVLAAMSQRRRARSGASAHRNRCSPTALCASAESENFSRLRAFRCSSCVYLDGAEDSGPCSAPPCAACGSEINIATFSAALQQERVLAEYSENVLLQVKTISEELMASAPSPQNGPDHLLVDGMQVFSEIQQRVKAADRLHSSHWMVSSLVDSYRDLAGSLTHALTSCGKVEEAAAIGVQQS